MCLTETKGCCESELGSNLSLRLMVLVNSGRIQVFYFCSGFKRGSRIPFEIRIRGNSENSSRILVLVDLRTRMILPKGPA